MKKLLILRHGPTQWNENHRIQGHTDIALNSTGRAVVGEWSVPAEFENFSCVTSPLSRAMETAALLGLTGRADAALKEMSWGDWEGQSLKALRGEFGEQMAKNEARGLDFCPPNGESPRAVQDRLRPWLKALETSTIVVAHRGVIRALYAMASDWDMTSKAPNRLDKFGAHLFQINDQGHPILERLNISLGRG